MFFGVIEGFYGRTWTWSQRRNMLDFLSANGFSHYLYAPKADPFLRMHWQHNWPEPVFAELQALADYAMQQQQRFGLGLSPLSLVDAWGREPRQQLQQRLQQIRQLNPAALAILFDDIKGDKQHLASRQAEVLDVVAQYLPDTQLLMCPTYYSRDPLLPQLFGAMPENYWQQLGDLLPTEVDIFWTGEQVISEQYRAEDLHSISELLQRQPVIWDNSRVNDGRKTSPFLPIKPMLSPEAISGNVRGLLVNPVNQPALAMINLKTLLLPGSNSERLEQALQSLMPELQNAIQQSLHWFNHVGLESLKDEDKQQIKALFSSSSLPAAQQIMQWLNGDYRFDPACLT